MRDVVVKMTSMGQPLGGEKIRYVETGRSMRKRNSDVGYVVTIPSNEIEKNEIGLYPILEVLVIDGALPNRFSIEGLTYLPIGDYQNDYS